MPKDPEQAIRQAVSATKLMEYTRGVSRWVRMSGSEDEAQAFDYLEATLRGFGLEVRRERHDALISWPKSASLEVVDPARAPVACITHSFSASTPPGGLEAEVVDVAGGDIAQAPVRGKIALVDGLAMPVTAHAAEAAGAVAAIFVNPPELHEMIISTVWGSPTPETLGVLPRIVAVSVRESDGVALRARAREGTLRVRVHAEVDTRWRPTPILTADLAGVDEPDRYVLFSGHVDSWHYGAMDNGSRNAVLHLNVDSSGAKGATVLSEGETMAETWASAARAINDVTGQALERRRIGRMGDQSFWGIGVPSMFGGVSVQPPAESATSDALAALHGGPRKSGGLGWWWHTTEDTIDKIDRANLRRDAEIYALVVWRWCTAPVLPLDYRATAGELRETLRRIQDAAGDAFNLDACLDAVTRLAGVADRLQAAADRLAAALGRSRGTRKQRAAASLINDTMMRAGRALIPINYTSTGPFDHDRAVPIPPVPSLQPAARLRTLERGTHEYHTLETRLVRDRNKVAHAIESAADTIEHAFKHLDVG